MKSLIELNNECMDAIFAHETACAPGKTAEETLLATIWDAYEPLAYYICREANRIAGEPKWAVDPLLRIVERDTIPKQYESVYDVPEGGSHD